MPGSDCKINTSLYNHHMDVLVIFPILFGAIIALVINYLGDILPASFFHLQPRCPREACGAAFSWKEYILLADCSTCGQRSRLRPILVLILVLAAALGFWFAPPRAVVPGYALLIFGYLLLLAVIDLEHHLLPLSLLLAGVLIVGIAGLLLHGWLDTLLGGLAGFLTMGIFHLFGRLYTHLQRRRHPEAPRSQDEALAFGDVLLGGLLGLLLGWPAILQGIFLGALLAALYSLVVILSLLSQGKASDRLVYTFIPLGPPFILAAWAMIFLPGWVNGTLS